MCTDCGCSDVQNTVVIDGVPVPLQDPTHDHGHHPIHDHTHPHDHVHLHDHEPHHHSHDHVHPHSHDHVHHEPVHDHVQTKDPISFSSAIQPQTISLHQGILSKNDHIAAHNRARFHAKGIFSLNILSSPGSGKTALLERMLQDQKAQNDHANHSHSHHLNHDQKALRIGVMVGDLATDNDAQRLRHASETPDQILQITTGTTCHLEAAMIERGSHQLDLDHVDLVIVENVGNLVCPAAYDLGEDLRVVLLSVTEGEDKPLKYPTAFKSADVVLISKIDIAEAVGFDRERALTTIRQVAPQAVIFEISSRTGKGMDQWWSYLRKLPDAHR